MPPEPAHQAAQSAFAAALWRDAPPPGLTAPDPAEVARRFAVYRNNVQHSLSRALAARFPVVERLVGAPFFAAMARVFIAQVPPTSPVMLAWGGDFPAFLDGFAPVAHLPWLSDVARLELARGRAVHAADGQPAPAADLAAALGGPDGAALRLVLHPGVALFASAHPAVSIWAAHQHPDPSPAAIPQGPEQALIARRPDNAVVVQPLDAPTHAVLSALAAGQPLGQACAAGDPTTALALLMGHGLILHTHTEELP